VFAFNKNTLAAVTLPGSAFAQLNTPRGIAYDSVNSRFYVANGGAQLNVYDASGNFLSSISQSIYGPSGTAFDPLDGTVWVTNLTGGSGVNPTYGVAEFNGFGAAEQGLNPASVFQAPIAPTAELPYAITYCAPAAASGAAYLAVGFEPDNSGRGFDQGGIPERHVMHPHGAAVRCRRRQAACLFDERQYRHRCRTEAAGKRIPVDEGADLRRLCRAGTGRAHGAAGAVRH
jgi:hypothetical protein